MPARIITVTRDHEIFLAANLKMIADLFRSLNETKAADLLMVFVETIKSPDIVTEVITINEETLEIMRPRKS